ncbi:META domain-containing protein [Phormidium sp. LEGE 05292]|uniref:META domain-containing protein n=1 Tax=[Phormidium] sp. LEGE 05292 TaxID=767427 RepID=UPI00187F7094|nr:META domain-containing protein [Phormidium sp. LEGE 05292]MBE9227629.1 META domain-containing protein [Phormidium sp. LEGE 05292]
MNLKTLVRQPLTSCIVTLIVGSVGITSINSVVAQQTAKNPTSSLEMAQSSSLQGSWRLANMALLDLPTPMVPSQELTADFSDGRISGSGGCNRFMGSYEIKGDRLTISPLASTFKACEEPIMTQESKYLKALQGAQRYELDDKGQLTIYYQTEQESGVLRFVSKNIRGLW